MLEKTFRTGRWTAALPLLALLVLCIIIGALPGTAQAQDKGAYHWERLDVRLDIKEGGRLEVAETHTYRFEKELTGDLYRSISLANLDRVSNVGLTRDGKSVDNETGTTGTAPHGAYYVRWEPGRIEIPETRTYVLKYSVAGAFTDVGGEHLFHWTALFPDRGAEVKAGSVTITVPDGSERLLDGLSVYGPGVRSDRDGNELKLTLLEALPASGALAVGMTLPPGTLGISKPNWQTAAERDAERAERNRILDAQKRERNAKIKKTIAWVFRITGLAGVLLTVLVAWRTLNSPVNHERRHENRVESPPSDLSPGMVSVLWNRQVTGVTFLSMIVDLCQRGLVRIECDGRHKNRPYLFHRLSNGMAEWERAMIALLPEKRVSRVELQHNLMYRSAGMRQILGDELVRRGMFDENPIEAKFNSGRPLWFALWGFAAVLTVFGMGFWVELFLPTFVAFFAALLTCALYYPLFPLNVGMVAPTEEGADEIARWYAFGEHLYGIGGKSDSTALLAHAVANNVATTDWMPKWGRGTPGWFDASGWSFNRGDVFPYFFTGWGLDTDLNTYGQYDDY